MTYWTLGQASKETGIVKSQLFKAIKSGRMSVVSKDSKGYQLDPAEVYRAFPVKTKNEEKKQLETPENSEKTGLYVEKIAVLEAQISALESQLEKSEARESQHLEEKKQLLGLLDKQGLMLEHLSKKEAPAAEPVEIPRRSWLRRLFGG